MAESKVKISIEAILQKEISEVVQKIHDDHGLVVHSVSFEWVHFIAAKSKIISCTTESTLRL